MTDRTVLDLSYDDLVAFLEPLAVTAFRARQIWHALYHDLATSYDGITTLPTPLRAKLAEQLPFPALIQANRSTSRDRRTTKQLFRLQDDQTIETVQMEYATRRTVCISTQIGCAIGCPLCATGKGGFIRNLAVGEIVAQVLEAARAFRSQGRPLTHVVYMGMGEPFLNYDATLASLRILNDHNGFNLGARSFVVSTSGVVPAIDRFAHEEIQANLAVSLHAATDALRDRLVPINRRYPLKSLMNACQSYVDATHRRVTFEIALIDGVNDSREHAREVASLLRGMLCHVNLIPLNPVAGSPWQPTPRDQLDLWVDVLSNARIPVTVRVSRGSEIQAGCGQLRARRQTAKGSRRKRP